MGRLVALPDIAVSARVGFGDRASVDKLHHRAGPTKLARAILPQSLAADRVGLLSTEPVEG
jgi:hypothetical protein